MKQTLYNTFMNEVALQTISGVIAISCLLMAGSTLYHERKETEQNLLNKGERVVRALSESAVSHLIQERYEPLQQNVSLLATDTQVAYCIVLDRHGRAVAHTQENKRLDFLTDNLTLKALGSPSPSRVSYRHPAIGKEVWELTSPVLHGSGTIGAIRLGLVAPSWSPTLVRYWKIIWIAVLLVSVAAWFYLDRKIFRPMATLTGRVKLAARDGDFNKVSTEALGVLKEVAENLNVLMDMFADLYKNNSGLEMTSKVAFYQKKRTEKMFDALDDAVLACDPSGNVVLANRACEPLLQVPLVEAPGKPLRETLTSETIASFVAEACSQKARVAKSSTEMSLNGDGSQPMARVTVYPMLDEESQMAGGVAVIQDISQQKLSESAQIEFVDNVVHEMRTPLTTITSYVELLISEGDKNPEMKYEFYNTIYEEAGRLNRLITNLLNISKMEMGSLTLQKSEVKLKNLLEEVVENNRAQATNKEIKLDLLLPDKLPTLEVDKDMLNVVLVNLVGNALKYTPEGGSVSVTVEESSDDLLVRIRDTGIGIPSEEIERVFVKFYRGEKAREQQAVGTGLGLALAKQIALLHNGDITVSSSLGEGTEFTLILPKGETEDVEASESEGSP